MTDTYTDDTEQVDGDGLEAEVRQVNNAKPSYSPELEWFGMCLAHETDGECFVFETFRYINRAALSALRDCGRTVRYIEAYEYGGEVAAQIQIPVYGAVPNRSVDMGTEHQEQS